MREPGIEPPVSSVEALVVRTPHDWVLTLGDRSAATRIDDGVLHALVRASGGASLEPDDPVRVALAAAGVSLPSGTTLVGSRLDDTAAADPGVAGMRRGGGRSLRPEDAVEPLPGFLARVIAGCLLIEGSDGKGVPLDETDLLLIEGVHGPTTVTTLFATVAAQTGSSAEVDGELGDRLRRISDAGRLVLVPTEVPDLDPNRGDLIEVESPVEPSGDVGVRGSGWKALVRRHRFPGRRYLIAGYRRARRIARGRRGPDAAGSSSQARTEVRAAVPDSAEDPPAERATVATGTTISSEEVAGGALDIRSDDVVSSAAALRRRGVPFHATVVVGQPDQTVESLWADLQFLIDHGIPARLQPFASQDGSGASPATSVAADDRDELRQIADAYLAFEHAGILRHVLRVVQWDHGVDASTLLRRLIEVSRDHPTRYPLINWVSRHFASFPLVPLGWRSFFDEVRRFLVDEFEVPLTSALDSVLALQAFLLPESGRRFPATITLGHDYVAYLADQTASRWDPD